MKIIRPRIEETFEGIRKLLDESGMKRASGNRVVLTGGACQLPGVRDLAARILGKQVRLARPAPLRGLPDVAAGPAFATAAGLLTWAAGAGQTFHDLDFEVDRPAGWFRRFVNFLRERM